MWPALRISIRTPKQRSRVGTAHQLARRRDCDDCHQRGQDPSQDVMAARAHGDVHVVPANQDRQHEDEDILIHETTCSEARRSAGVCASPTVPLSIALSVRARCASPYSKSCETRHACRPPSNGVSRNTCTSRSSISHPVRRSDRARTFASLCRRESSVISGSNTAAQRTPGTLLAAIAMPKLEPQTTMPRSACPDATASPTAYPNCG